MNQLPCKFNAKDFIPYLEGTVGLFQQDGIYILKGLVTERDHTGKVIVSAEVAESNAIYRVALDQVIPKQTYRTRKQQG